MLGLARIGTVLPQSISKCVAVRFGSPNSLGTAGLFRDGPKYYQPKSEVVAGPYQAISALELPQFSDDERKLRKH